MSVVGDALNALRQVILMQSRMDQLDRRIGGLASDVDGLTDALADVRDRVSRLEGVIEGAAMARAAIGSPQRRIEE